MPYVTDMGVNYMDLLDFKKVRSQFADADIDGKIDLYVSTEGLTQTQYRELLQIFPVNELHRLEAALQ